MNVRSLALPNPFVRQNVTKIKIQPALGASYTRTYLLSVGLLGICAVVLFSYILGVNSYTSTGYEIKQMQTKLSNLNDQNRQLTLQISEVSSIVKIQTDFANSNFVPVGTPKFLQLGQPNQLSER